MVACYRHCCSVYVAPATAGTVRLNYKIPDLLDMGCAYGHAPALYQESFDGWKAYSYQEFRTAAEELALGLKAQEGLFSEGGHVSVRIGLLLTNDLNWAMVDMGSLLAGWVTVPLDAGQPVEALDWIAQDADLHALVVSSDRILSNLPGVLKQIKLIVTVDDIFPRAVVPESTGCVITTMETLRGIGRRRHSPELVQALKDALHPEDLATIVYTADAHGIAKGALLSHRSLTGNIWAAFSSMPGLVPGRAEVALSFLPLNHIFARTFLYGHFGFGHDIYFSSPKRVLRHLVTVKPTIFITVPRLLEKIYERVNSLRQQSSGWRRFLGDWSWWWAHRYRLERGHWRWYRLQRWCLGYGLYKTLRDAFGGRIRYLLSGGAALRPDVMTFFNAVGVPVRQGYGLTETSSVLSYTRDRWLRTGTVGVPIPGVEMRLAGDGEVLVKSSYTMEGYHHNPLATQTVIDADGWFHTGDFGSFADDGVLTLQGCKKELFKLSTGKYVAPGPIEAQLEQSPLVRQALLVGPGQKFCGVLLVTDFEMEEDMGRQLQTLIDQVNGHLSHWSTIKRFARVESKAIDGASRENLYRAYAKEIEALYCNADVGCQLWRREFSGSLWGWLWPLFKRNQEVKVM